jgi:hypothetical protein
MLVWSDRREASQHTALASRLALDLSCMAGNTTGGIQYFRQSAPGGDYYAVPLSENPFRNVRAPYGTSVPALGDINGDGTLELVGLLLPRSQPLDLRASSRLTRRTES